MSKGQGIILNENYDVYRKLQEQLDKMPVGMPKTQSGVEIRILKQLFTPLEAEIALHLNILSESIDRIYRRIKKSGNDITKDELLNVLDRMQKKGLIFYEPEKKKKSYSYALFALGMYEFQVDRMNKELYKDCEEYILNDFGKDIHKYKFPQLRVVPVSESITPDLNVATYDDIAKFVSLQEGEFALLNCICKQGKDMISQSCKTTEIRETCLIMPCSAQTFLNFETGRPICKDEALKVLERAEKEGLVLQPTNSRNPIAVCCCCGDCCGLLTSAKKFPKPAELFATNYFALINKNICPEQDSGDCDLCLKRCQMEAIDINADGASVNLDRCIGCGLCLSVCPKKAITLEKKEKEIRPLSSSTMFYTRLMIKKVGLKRAIRYKIKYLLGMKV